MLLDRVRAMRTVLQDALDLSADNDNPWPCDYCQELNDHRADCALYKAYRTADEVVAMLTSCAPLKIVRTDNLTAAEASQCIVCREAFQPGVYPHGVKDTKKVATVYIHDTCYKEYLGGK